MIGDPVFSLLRGKYSGRPLLAAPKYLPTWAQPNFHCHCPNLEGEEPVQHYQKVGGKQNIGHTPMLMFSSSGSPVCSGRDDTIIKPRTLLQELRNTVFLARAEQNNIATSSGRSDTNLV